MNSQWKRSARLWVKKEWKVVFFVERFPRYQNWNGMNRINRHTHTSTHIALFRSWLRVSKTLLKRVVENRSVWFSHKLEICVIRSAGIMQRGEKILSGLWEFCLGQWSWLNFSRAVKLFGFIFLFTSLWCIEFTENLQRENSVNSHYTLPTHYNAIPFRKSG